MRRISTHGKRTLLWAAGGAAVVTVALLGAGTAHATTVRVEAESAGCTGGSVYSSTGASGGQARYSSVPASITCTITVAAGETAPAVILGTYVSGNAAHTVSITVDGGGAMTANQAGTAGWTTRSYSVELTAGSHTIVVTSGGGATYNYVDYVEVNGAVAATTTTTTAATTTTVPATTTTTAPATTTTTAPAETTTTTTAPDTTTTTQPTGSYPTTSTDVQYFGAILGLTCGVICGSTLFANTWKDDDPR